MHAQYFPCIQMDPVHQCSQFQVLREGKYGKNVPHYAHNGIHSEYNQKRQVISTHTALSASVLSISLKISEIVNFLLFFSAFWAFGKVS
ncbi:unnamed protein product [Staurois parvus]|uniref:Uncharacterized protein n=1 Tax=Staurois parvus TaxID=386267 RepID=A0ABN9CQI6_9NEOB|nr:unnamed protein product [Staurois parvus]